MVANPGRSQTLDRGLYLLELLAAAAHPLTTAQLAERAELHRSVVYRLLRTLEDHRLVDRTSGDQFVLGLGLAILARGLKHDLRDLVLPDLQDLADRTDAGAFFAILEGADEVVAQVVAEPTLSDSLFIHRIGYRHRTDKGAAGHAIRMSTGEAGRDAADASRLAEFRAQGWASSAGELLDGVRSVAAPVQGMSRPAVVAITYVGERDLTALARIVVETATVLSRRLGSVLSA